jgi:membrane protein DedA with SNARE-associated domain
MLETTHMHLNLHLHLPQLLSDYGYYAVFFLGLLEGETILLLGAYAVHEGYLSFWPLVAFGASAAFLTDQFYFFLGRKKGPQVIERHPKMHARFQRAFAFVQRRPVLTVLLMRFAWGLRILFPVALGMTKMRAAVYIPLSAVASVLWALAVCWFGVAVSDAAHAIFGSLRPYDHALIFVALLIGLWVAVRHIKME